MAIEYRHCIYIYIGKHTGTDQRALYIHKEHALLTAVEFTTVQLSALQQFQF